MTWTKVSDAAGYAVSKDGGKTWISPTIAAAVVTTTIPALTANTKHVVAIKTLGDNITTYDSSPITIEVTTKAS